jgi:hypothetical protein
MQKSCDLPIPHPKIQKPGKRKALGDIDPQRNIIIIIINNKKNIWTRGIVVCIATGYGLDD